MRKFHEGKKEKRSSVEVWGSGNPLREFLHVDDLADACLFLMNGYSDLQFVNIGTGKELSVKELSFLIKRIVGYEGEIVFDPTKPDGTERKLMDVTKLTRLGWTYKIELEEGLRMVFENEFLKKT